MTLAGLSRGGHQPLKTEAALLVKKKSEVILTYMTIFTIFDHSDSHSHMSQSLLPLPRPLLAESTSEGKLTACKNQHNHKIYESF